MSKIYNSITELIGNTPIVKLNNIVPEDAADVYVKSKLSTLVLLSKTVLPFV